MADKSRGGLVFGITKIISKKQEDLAGFELVALTCAEAYAELRRVCPLGDLRIHLSTEYDETSERILESR
jgi:hypothetical protein